MSAKKGLGSGLSALFGEEETVAVNTAETLPIEKVEPRAGQPRTSFDEEALRELADSIERHGLIQPIIVKPLEDGYYQIVAGERRWRASRMAGLTEIPVRVIDADERATEELALIENLQREDLNPVEEARGYKTLMADFGLTQEDVAKTIGKSRPAIANSLRLLSLCPEVLGLLESGGISAGHARALLALPDAGAQGRLAEKITEKGLSVRQTEAAVAALLKPEPEPAEKEAVNYSEVAAEELGRFLGRGVKIVDGRKKGRIELEYYGADDREALLKKLKSLK